MTSKILATVLVILFCLPARSQSQEPGFVEVLVTDSIHVMPDQFVLLITIDPEDVYPYKAPTTDGITKNLDQKTQVIRSAIRSLGIDTIDSNESVAEFPRTKVRWLKLVFTSQQQLRQFIKSVRNVTGLSGYITSKKFSAMDSAVNKVVQKIVKTSGTQAAAIAAYSGKTLGALLSVKEEGAETDKVVGGWTSYPPLSALANAEMVSIDPEIIVEKTYRVRYAWK